MPIARLNQWLARFPALKRTLVRVAALVPALDMRLRVAAHEGRHGRSQVRIDAANLPEDALPLYRRLVHGEEGKRRA